MLTKSGLDMAESIWKLIGSCLFKVFIILIGISYGISSHIIEIVVLASLVPST